MSKPRSESTATCARALLRWFERVGYVRICDTDRRLEEGQAYKKGHEVRFLLSTRDQVREVRRLARAVGLQPGAPYAKHPRIVQPLYGFNALDWFLKRLPAGRARAAMGFSSRGQRTVRRPRSAAASSGRVRRPSKPSRPPATTRNKRKSSKRQRSRR